MPDEVLSLALLQDSAFSASHVSRYAPCFITPEKVAFCNARLNFFRLREGDNGGLAHRLIDSLRCSRSRRASLGQGEPGLKPGEAKTADDPLGNCAPAFRCDTAAAFDEFGLGRRINHVALAERLPIQTVSLVQNDSFYACKPLPTLPGVFLLYCSPFRIIV